MLGPLLSLRTLLAFLFLVPVPGLLAVTISPTQATVLENASQQFTASTASTWTTDCGSISTTGLLKAPLYPKTCKITATATNGSGSASVSVNVVSPITISPIGPKTPQNATQQFTANASVTWSATKCGTISASGLFTASAPVGSSCTIVATAASGTKFTAYGFDLVAAPTSFTFSPINLTLTENGTQQFTPTSAASWSATCGTISSSGLYTAPLVPGSCTITATATNGTGNTASTTATITSPLSITPVSATTGQALTQQFTASLPVTWAASCGSINTSGLFTASASIGSICTITATASTGTAYTTSANDTISQPTLTISPTPVTVQENATQQFTASKGATWATNCGSISSTGLFKAPLYPKACTVTATATDSSGQTSTASANVVSPITITPVAPKTPLGGTQQFSASAQVTWAVSKCGTINASGLFTASSGSVGTNCTIVATAASAPAYTAYGYTMIAPATSFAILPANPSLTEGAAQQFSATAAATWTTTCGAISATGLYTAPLVPGPCTITGTTTDGSNQTATTIATTTSPIVITPASATTGQGQTQLFTANQPVTWAASCGIIDPNSGLFTASPAQNTMCKITATATSGTAYTANATDTVGPPPAFSISPTSPTLSEGAAQQFTANVAATWTATCGSIDPNSGSYTAPLVPGSCTITASATYGGANPVTTSATITAPLTITPATASTPQGQTQLFTASSPVTWSTTCGIIDPNTGLFTASAAKGSNCTITGTAKSGTAFTATASDTIATPPAFTISPLSPTLTAGTTQQFTANVVATWSASCGSIDANGLYTAPLIGGSCNITATATYGGGTAPTTATITSPLAVTPASATTPQLQKQQFTANMSVNWSASCGSIDVTGLFTASASPSSTCIITAVASSGLAYTATAVATVGPPPPFAILPLNPTLNEAAMQIFTSDLPATWTASCGSIVASSNNDGSFTYTAPLTPGPCTITASASDGTGHTASTIATVTSPITITPAAARTTQAHTTLFSANLPVTWQASCGSIDTTGLFTASGSPNTVCSITATATGSTAYTATALDTVDAPVVLTVSPVNPTVGEGAPQPFTSNDTVSWGASCGTINANGTYTAPLGTAPCTITATATDGTGRTASTTATITSPLVITPPSATTPQGLTQLYSVNTPPVAWTTDCGTIDTNGTFTASAPLNSTCTITATATSGTAYTISAVNTVSAPPLLVISPVSSPLSQGAKQQFTSNIPAAWIASCGTIDAKGLYTAPLLSGTCTVTGTAIYGSGNTASSTATITSPLAITPASGTTPQGQTQQFTVNTPPVSWSASCGSIDPNSGLFTASASPNTTCTISATASTGLAYTTTASTTIGTPPALAISPANPTVSEGAQQQFTSNVATTWTASCGSVDTKGLYTAPLATGACTITGTAIYGTGNTASTSAAITSPLTIAPATATTLQGQTQQFSASPVPVTWNASCGSIDTTGLFTASASSPGNCTITATASSGPAYTATAVDTIGTPPTLTLSPTSPTVSEGMQQQFTSNVAVTWTASCGTIDSTGLFTAPLAAGSCTITANATNGTGNTASTSATVTSPITITPATVALHAIGSAQFTANAQVNWSSSCGNIDANSGLFTAPASASTCTVTATATGGAAYTTQATAVVDVVNYVTGRGDHSNVGVQANETLLTPTNVNASQFGQKWIQNVDGEVYAQPLYMNGLNINGAPHNVVYVASMNNTVYAFDGDSGAPYWTTNYSAPAVTGITIDTKYIPQIGILSTPVIDPASGTLYFVTDTADQCCDVNGKAIVATHRLHAVSLTTGSEKFNGPVTISDPNLDPIHKLQRPGLILANGMVYIAFGSVADKGTWNGLLFAFDKQTLAKQYVWNATPSGIDGGIWMSGVPPAVDAAGNLYLTTGNGTFDGVNNYGMAAVKLSPTLQVLDYFAPYNWSTLSSTDLDLGSGGITIIPDQNGPYQHELITCGKTPSIYVLNRDNMGGLGTTSDNIIQRLDHALGVVGGTIQGHDQTCFAAPTYFNGNVYFVGLYDVVKMFSLNPATGLLSTSPVSQGSFSYFRPGSQPVISASGASNGIVWTINQATGQLFANDASDVSRQLFSATITPGFLNRLTSPTIVNGYVYVGGKSKVAAFTLTNH